MAGRTEKLGIDPATAQLELGLGLSLAMTVREKQLNLANFCFSLTLHGGIGVRRSLNFTTSFAENDIAVMKVKNASSLKCRRDSIWPACLPDKNTDYSGWKNAIVSGWGKVNGSEEVSFSVPRVLRKTEVPIVSNEECYANVII